MSESLQLKLELSGIKDQVPQYFMLSNQNLRVFTNTYGGGYIKLNDSFITTRRDIREDGIFFYVKDLGTNKYWSTTLWPCIGTESLPLEYSFEFNGKSTKFYRKDADIESITETVVVQHENIEIRKVTLHNISSVKKDLEITSYTDVVLLDDNRKDLDHPQFYNLFVQSRFDPEIKGIFFNRRSFSNKTNPPELFCKMYVNDKCLSEITYETSRANFIGRLRDLSNPVAMEKSLTNFVGDILDPCMSFRVACSLNPDETMDFYFITTHDTYQDTITNLATQFPTYGSIAELFEKSLSTENIVIKELNLFPDKVLLYQRIGSLMLAGNTHTDLIKKELPKNVGHVDSLWKNRISGDFPVFLIIIDNMYFDELVIDIVNCHEYLTRLGHDLDVVFLNETNMPEASAALRSQIEQLGFESKLNRNKGLYVLDRTYMDPVDSLYLKHFAQLIVNGSTFNKTLANE